MPLVTRVSVAASSSPLLLPITRLTSENLLAVLAYGDKFKYFQVGAYVEHVPTGLFVYGAYGTQ